MFSNSVVSFCDPMHCPMPGFPVLHQFPEFTQTHIHWVVMPSNHLTLCWPLLLLPSIFANIRVFSNESTLHIRWQSIGASASASVLLMNIKYWFTLGLTGLISLLSKDSQEFSIALQVERISFWCSAFFMVQLSHSYTTTRKIIAFTISNFIGKVMSLLLICCPGLS